jgi:uncharacterized membrane protein YgdD (TMEM256/DUF423 family)
MAIGERQVAGLEWPDFGKEVAAWHVFNCIASLDKNEVFRACFYERAGAAEILGMERIFVAAGGVFGAAFVGMAAVAAHALRRLDPAALEAVRSAVQIQGFCAVALVLTGFWHARTTGVSRAIASLAGVGFVAGMVFFCGAIYAHRLGGVALGPLAPVGGVTLIAAWLLLAASALAARPGR